MDFAGYREKLASFTAKDVGDDRHLDILAWLTELAQECGLSRPVLVGCGAVEVYTSACTATGDVDVIIDDIPAITSCLLDVGFQRSSDQRFYYFPGYAILFEFPSKSLRPGEQTIKLKHNGIDCEILSPEDLIVDRLESFEASGGGVDLYHAYLIYHLHNERLDPQRLIINVKNRDVRESFIFIRDLHEDVVKNTFTLEKQAERLVKECRRRRGTA